MFGTVRIYRLHHAHRDRSTFRKGSSRTTALRNGLVSAKFAVEYDCVAYRPFKNEVLDAVVTQVNKFGFFAEAGPLQLFVSNSLVPDDVKYVTDENCYKSDDGQITIGVDCEVRVKIVGMRIDANDIFCIATIKEDYLGLIGYAEGDAAVGAV